MARWVPGVVTLTRKVVAEPGEGAAASSCVNGELHVELRDRGIGPGNDECDARNGRIVGGRDVQGVDVVAPARKHAGHARQRTYFVLQQYRDRVSHRPLHLANRIN